MILGAIIAGGGARRFGSDKGSALLDQRALIDHVADGLIPHCAELIICGREWPGLRSVGDRPVPGLGPLGGLNAALFDAQCNGYAYVLSAACDVLPVIAPDDFPAAVGLENCAYYIDDHYLSALWPTSLAPALDQYLTNGQNRSIRGWLQYCGARAQPSPHRLFNFNTQADLVRYQGERPALKPRAPC